METILINNELIVPCPEGFHVMNEEERSGLPFGDSGPCESLSAPDRHIIMTIGWKRLTGLFSGRQTEERLAVKAESVYGKLMRKYDYHMEGFLTREACGRTIPGYDFSYQASGTEMYGETLVLKIEKTVYYVNFYTRLEWKEENLRLLDEMMNGTSTS